MIIDLRPPLNQDSFIHQRYDSSQETLEHQFQQPRKLHLNYVRQSSSPYEKLNLLHSINNSIHKLLHPKTSRKPEVEQINYSLPPIKQRFEDQYTYIQKEYKDRIQQNDNVRPRFPKLMILKGELNQYQKEQKHSMLSHANKLLQLEELDNQVNLKSQTITTQHQPNYIQLQKKYQTADQKDLVQLVNKQKQRIAYTKKYSSSSSQNSNRFEENLLVKPNNVKLLKELKQNDINYQNRDENPQDSQAFYFQNKLQSKSSQDEKKEDSTCNSSVFEPLFTKKTYQELIQKKLHNDKMNDQKTNQELEFEQVLQSKNKSAPKARKDSFDYNPPQAKRQDQRLEPIEKRHNRFQILMNQKHEGQLDELEIMLKNSKLQKKKLAKLKTNGERTKKNVTFQLDSEN